MKRSEIIIRWAGCILPKTKVLISLTFLCLIFISLNTSAQTFSISGTVKDEKGQNIRGATVFLSNSTRITQTNERGEFRLNQLQPGSYEVVLQMLGFEPQTLAVILRQSSINIDIRLKEISTLLDEVVVRPNPNRDRYLTLFLRFFMGQTANAQKSKLTNPGALNLYYDDSKQVLEARSPEFLVIENQGLGYRLRYLLNNFKLDFRNHILSYSGSPYFEELEGSKSEQKRWESNREIAYLGSTMHFFRSVFTNSTKAEGFLLYKLPDNIFYEKALKTSIPPASPDSIFTQVDKNFRMISRSSIRDTSFVNGAISAIDSIERDLKKNNLYVVYTKEREASGFVPSLGRITMPFRLPSRQSQVSQIDLLIDSILIDRNGGFSPSSFLFNGSWSWERIADLLPLDYVSNSADRPIVPASAEIKEMITQADTLRDRMPVEKVWLHLDKPYYSSGDSLRFKAYLFDGATMAASEKSGLLYLELANDTGKVLLRNMVRMEHGLGRGYLVLNKENIPQGSYVMRAYTNVIRNFGEDYLFKKNFYIGSATENSWLLRSELKQNKAAGNDSIHLALRFHTAKQEAITLRDLQLRIMDGGKMLSREKVQTDVDGGLNVSFILPEKTNGRNISIIAEDLNPAEKGEINRKVVIPVNVRKDIDLQFMPEGGNLVAGIAAKVAFKAIGEDGKGADVSGKVISSSKEVTVFTPTHKGMGSFDFIPEAGESYTAKITLVDGTIKDYPLPKVKDSGTALRILNPEESDSLEVSVSVTADMPSAAYYLIGQARGVICYGAVVRIDENIVNTRKIAKAFFPSGITRFSLLTMEKQPLNERMVYIDHQDNLEIKISPDKTFYGVRDSVALNIRVTDKDNLPVQGSFSLAVTDDSQVRADQMGSTMLTNLLLTSGLKGNIEEAGYYFNELKGDPKDSAKSVKLKGDTGNRWSDLDNLLLTQGWVGYDWKQILNPPAVAEYSAEPSLVIKGKINNVKGKDMPNTKVRLMSQKPLLFGDVPIDQSGRFSLKNFHQVDTVAFLLRASGKEGKNSDIDIQVEEFKAPVFQAGNERYIPWYINTDSTFLENINSSLRQKEEDARLLGNVLEAVSITAKKIVNGSKNLNGPGNADQILDVKEMEEAKKMSLLQVLQQKIKGFNEALFPLNPPISVGLNPVLPAPPKMSYKIFDKEAHFIIDGMDLDDFYAETDGLPANVMLRDRMEFIRTYLDFIKADAIKGIEVMTSSEFYNKYYTNYLSQKESDVMLSSASFPGYVFIEITTWDGNGASLIKNPGVFLYRGMPFADSKQFYSPKYTAKDSVAHRTDLRSTIYWEPDVMTDADGKARVEFYTADKTGTYTVTAEGSDMSGNIGSKTSSIKILKEAKWVNSLIASVDTLRNLKSIEKTWLQLDKPYYVTGDTLWFKAYLFDADLVGSEKSEFLYVELVNDMDTVLQRNTVRMTAGIGWGSLILNVDNPEGIYTLRAFTNLMRNFGDDHIFRKAFYIGSPAQGNWLINTDLKLSKHAEKDSVSLALQFRQLNKEPLSLRDLDLQVMERRNFRGKDEPDARTSFRDLTLFRRQVHTDVDGELNVNFPLPEKTDAGNIYMIAQDLRKGDGNRKIQLHLPVSRPENIDFQFMPEGGNLVSGFINKIGFKAIGEDGKGIETVGKIYSSGGQEVTAFSSGYKGMGSFEFIPQAGESYIAKISSADTAAKGYPLPEVKNQGTILRILNREESDSLEVIVGMTAKQSTPASYYLVARSGGLISYGEMIRFNGTTATKKIPKQLFPTGITRFTVLAAVPVRNNPGSIQPLNERSVYIDHDDNLKIWVNPDNSLYNTRDSIALNIQVTDKKNQPVQGNFSLAVTDDSQVNIDDLNASILTNLLFTSDLKGNIETPGYYFQKEKGRWQALDNLLLTQGWVGYEWKEVFNPPAVFKYAAEPELIVSGKTTTAFGKGIEGSKVRLISHKPVLVRDTLTNAEGRFSFKGFPRIDTAAFLLKAINKNGNSFNIGIEADEFQPLVFTGSTEPLTPWFLNTDTSMVKFISSTIIRQAEQLKISGLGTMLNEVSIIGKKVIRDSKNLNGPGNSDRAFDQKNIDQGMQLKDVIKKKGESMTLGDLLAKLKVKGYLIFDGMDPTKFDIDFNLLEYFKAEDVKGIEVMLAPSKNWKAYAFQFDSQAPVYVEITTYAGKGPLVKKIPGMYFYKPIPLVSSRTFYSPKYAIKDRVTGSSDLRSTIHWEPDIITDSEGRATVTFYSADRPGTYTIITEGSDMNGNIGSEKARINIIPRPPK